MYLVILIAIFILSDYRQKVEKESQYIESGLEVIDMVSSLGGMGENEQIYTYQITLSNHEKEEITINWIEPVLHEEMLKRLGNESNRVNVNKTIQPGETLEIKGSVVFESKGITKEEINDWDPLNSGFKVSTEKVLSIGKSSKP